MLLLFLLLCSHSPNDVPPEPQRNVSIAAVRGAMRPSKCMNARDCKVYIGGVVDVAHFIAGHEQTQFNRALSVLHISLLALNIPS